MNIFALIWSEEYTTAYSWVFEVALVLLLTLLFHYVVALLTKRFLPRLRKSRKVWDDAFLIAVVPPLKVLIWIIGISMTGVIIREGFWKVGPLNLIEPIRDTAYLLLFVWFSIAFIREVERKYLRRKPGQEWIDRTMVKAIGQLSRIGIFAISALIFLQMRGIPISGVVALGGLGGVAIGFAAKDLLANFFGGLMIFLDRPFVIGDWISSPEKQIEGHVEHIGWRLTQILTLEKRPIYVPNALFSTIVVQNSSRMTNRRIMTSLGIRYADSKKMASIVEGIEKMLCSHPQIDQNRIRLAKFNDFGESSLEILLHCFTIPTELSQFRAVQQDVFIKVLEIVEAHGAQCAFPTRTVHMTGGIEPLTK